MAKKKETTSAGSRIKAAGKSLVWVTLDDEQKNIVRLAAAAEGVPMSQFCVQAAVAAAEKILSKKQIRP